MEIYPPKKIKIARVKGKGRGVFATKKIHTGEIIEYCPVIFISEKESLFFEKEDTVLEYYYMFQREFNNSCVIFGYGSIYNHSRNPNAEVDYNLKKLQNFVLFRAIKNIKPGEEITFDYEFVNGKEEFFKLPF